jgi:hypothetical protein
MSGIDSYLFMWFTLLFFLNQIKPRIDYLLYYEGMSCTTEFTAKSPFTARLGSVAINRSKLQCEAKLNLQKKLNRYIPTAAFNLSVFGLCIFLRQQLLWKVGDIIFLY